MPKRVLWLSRENLQKITTCCYFLNGLSGSKRACEFCVVAVSCDHLDRSMPYILAPEGEEPVAQMQG